MIRQSQQQKLLQKLSPQQIQLMKLLQIPTAQLDDRIKEELEENPALEVGAEEEADEFSDSPEDELESNSDELEDDGMQTIDVEDFLSKGEDDSSDYSYNSDDYSEEKHETPIRMEDSFHEHLLAQIGMLELDDRQQALAEQIIGSIDEDGYLRREPAAIADDLAFSRNIEADDKEVLSIIRDIQMQMDPPGICARNLQECLLIQLQRLPQNNLTELAFKAIDKYFNEFTKKHYERVQRGLKVEDDIFRQVIQVIRHLNPKPGGNFSSLSKAEQYIVPDFFIFNNNGNLELTLNSRNAPELRVSESYKEMLKAYDRGDKKNREQRDAVLFIKQKLDSAKWFIDAILQRQQTLLLTMHAIMNIQQAFFLSGDDTSMRPMILKDIAQRTDLDISTVSRVANSKYVQTEFGTYKLKHFFSEGMQTDSGEEVSTREVKSILEGLISSEDKRHPLSDDQLTEMLQAKGYPIARRTVAKYREQLGIGVARLRRDV